ncbi:hypothetical protein JCM19237_1381 [Photobacterium aphoticum]|uniref:Uncharacterized protein n=1 Tax=Photobacterium aphoticum TaxID=754436 RepID=A0A090QX47_9GAMM|nr:hypothetical protein JCM19237_1381 [Photobacterium aphoticum]
MKLTFTLPSVAVYLPLPERVSKQRMLNNCDALSQKKVMNATGKRLLSVVCEI